MRQQDSRTEKRKRRAFRKRVMRPLIKRDVGESMFVCSDGSHITLSVRVGWAREYVQLDADEVEAILKFCREVKR